MLRSFTTPGRTQWGWLASEPFLLTVCLEPHNGALLPTIAAWQTELLADTECEGCVRSCQTTFFQMVANRTGTENSLVCCFLYFIVVARQKSLTAFQYSVTRKREAVRPWLWPPAACHPIAQHTGSCLQETHTCCPCARNLSVTHIDPPSEARPLYRGATKAQLLFHCGNRYLMI